MLLRPTTLSLLYVPLAVLLASCNSPDSSKSHAEEAATSPAAADQLPATAAAPPCLERMQGFLRWYHRRYTAEFDTTTDFINIPLTGDEDAATLAKIPRSNISSTNYMQLNHRKLAVYIDTLRRSGYFSASYLAAKQASILERGQELEAEKVTEGLLEGFDSDEVIHTQDIYQREDINKLTAYQPAGLKPGTQAYRLQLSSLGEENFSWVFYVKQEKGRCVIDSVHTTE